MRRNWFTTLIAAAIVQLGLLAGPASATPSVTLGFDGFFAAVVGAGGTFADFFEAGLIPEIPADVGAALDVFEPFGAVAGLHYDIAVDDPEPSTPRNWLLDIDLGIEGLVFPETEGDPAPFDAAFSETGIPIADILGGPFSVDDLADLGGFILGELLLPCAAAAPAATPIDGGAVGACLYLGTDPFLSGDIFIGLTEDFVESDVGPILGGLLDAAPIDGDFFAVSALFGGDLGLRVPEPGTAWLILSGLLAWGALGIRRRRTRLAA